MLIRAVILLIFFGFFSCDQNKVFDKYQTISNQWNKDSLINFNFDLKANRYNTFVNIRTDKKYKFNNLFLIVTVSDSTQVILKDTLEYKMADSKGALLGNRLLNTFDNKLWHKKSMIFEKGKHSVSIQHAMRKINQINGLKSLDGIINIGYRIEKDTEK
jgi:gliding motility-associated lipoprotein GldH